MSSHKDYKVDWVSRFLHRFPHIDFDFQETNSTFDPESENYKEVSLAVHLHYPVRAASRSAFSSHSSRSDQVLGS